MTERIAVELGQDRGMWDMGSRRLGERWLPLVSSSLRWNKISV